MKLPTDTRFKNLTGKTFGRLSVIEYAGTKSTPRGFSVKHWRCRCECGKEVVVAASNLRVSTRSCGCLRNEKAKQQIKNLVGKRFGRLLVISREPDRKRHRYWLCKCDCGNMQVSSGSALKRGASNSCGCLCRDVNSSLHRTHGLSGNIVISVWHSMISRCYDKRNRNYRYYGGRGISVCQQWRESIGCFLKDMGERPSKKHSIDRIDNDGNYEPSNCRWATTSQQNRNNRHAILVTHNGKTQCLSDWAKELGISLGKVSYWRSKGKSPKQALGLV